MTRLKELAHTLLESTQNDIKLSMIQNEISRQAHSDRIKFLEAGSRVFRENTAEYLNILMLLGNHFRIIGCGSYGVILQSLDNKFV